MGSAPARRAKVGYLPKVVLRSSGAPRRRGTRPWSSSQRPRARRGSTCSCRDNTPSTTGRAPRSGARQWRGPGCRPGHSHRCGWLGRPVPDRLRIIVAASLKVRAEQRLVLHSPGSGPGTAVLFQESSGGQRTSRSPHWRVSRLLHLTERVCCLICTTVPSPDEADLDDDIAG